MMRSYDRFAPLPALENDRTATEVAWRRRSGPVPSRVLLVECALAIEAAFPLMTALLLALAAWAE